MVEPVVLLDEFMGGFRTSPLARWRSSAPWELTRQSEAVVRQLLAALAIGDFNVSGEIAVHKTAIVEAGAVLKGPLILGPHCYVAAGAYLRGGNWVDERCTFGPGAELKSSFVFAGTKLAHFNFVGDSVLGSDVNLEAGSIICNYRNEREAPGAIVRPGTVVRRASLLDDEKAEGR